ncbi:hypothetical protein BURMUCGD1_3293 [Burkholderia multivorans CGD1]|nr:hypothetical protein BURMUCGD1_3293 [Burkholderia multivorans CGD1]
MPRRLQNKTARSQGGRAVGAGGASLRRARDYSAWPRASFEWCRE